MLGQQLCADLFVAPHSLDLDDVTLTMTLYYYGFRPSG